MTAKPNLQLTTQSLLLAWFAAAAWALLPGCGGSNPQNIRANPAPIRTDFPYQVTGITQAVFGGDNFQMFEGTHLHYIVLEGIDSPKPGQPFYVESRDALAKLLRGIEIEVTIIRHDPDYREIGFAYLDGASDVVDSERSSSSTNSESTFGLKGHHRNIDVGYEIIRQGLGWYDGATFQGDDLYREAQAEAKAAKRGLWVQENPVAPWDYEAMQNQK
jgi:endonuclease YncB( thermonuclease family)